MGPRTLKIQTQTAQNGDGGGGLKMKISALEPNSTKFCIHNQWATKRLKMQKLTGQNGEGGEKNKNLGPCTKLNCAA